MHRLDTHPDTRTLLPRREVTKKKTHIIPGASPDTGCTTSNPNQAAELCRGIKKTGYNDWGCTSWNVGPGSTFYLDVTQSTTVPALTDGDSATDAQATCDSLTTWEMHQDIIHQGKFVLDFNELDASQSRSYTIAYSSDGQNWKQMAQCTFGPRPDCMTMSSYVYSPRSGCLLGQGFEITPPDEK